jgi:hypothetical protein
MQRLENDGMDDLGVVGILILGVVVAIGALAVAFYIWWIS